MRSNNRQLKHFKCANCKHEFYAQETLDLVCPSCKSENIDEAKGNNKSGVILRSLVFVAAVAVGYFVAPILMGNEEPKQSDTKKVILTSSQTGKDNPLIQPAVIDSIEPAEEAVPKNVEITTSFDKVVNMNDSYIYSFDAHCNLDGQEELVYELLDADVDSVIMQTHDGKFQNIKPSETGMYRFRVRVEKYGQTSDPKAVTGFVKRPIVKVKPLSKEELEKLINQLAAKDRPDIHKDVKIDYTSTVKDGVSTLADVMNICLAIGDWKSVKVLDVGYNDMNQVVRVELDVVYPE